MGQTAQITLARTIPLGGVLNARELGGLPLGGGRQVRWGCLIRSGRLSDMTGRDRELLTERWNVTDIVDLRDAQEVAEHPDLPLAGARFHHLPLFQGKKPGISKEDNGLSMEDRAIQVAEGLRGGGARALLRRLYPDMVLDAACVEQLRTFFQLLLAHGEGALIWHCTSGKDRTGLSCALLLLALGASWNTVLEDYLMTNLQVREHVSRLCAAMRVRGADDRLIEEIRCLETVDPSYLESSMAAVARTYCSVEKFLEQRLGLTEEYQQLLREKYTV